MWMHSPWMAVFSTRLLRRAAHARREAARPGAGTVDGRSRSEASS
jgi:hypothetical protein